MSHLYKRRKNGQLTSPFWWGSFVHPTTGQKVRRSTRRRIDGGKAEKDRARQVLAKWETEALDEVQLGVKKTGKLGEVLEEYLSACTHQASYRDKVTFRRKLLGELKPQGRKDEPDPTLRFSFEKSREFHSLTQADITKLRSARLAEGNSQRTVDAEITFLQGAHTHAREIMSIKVPEIKFPRYNPEGRLRYFTQDECTRILTELDPRREGNGLAKYENRRPEIRDAMQDAYDLTVILMDTGCRANEITSLRWDMVDTHSWIWINIYRSKVGNEGQLAMTNRVREVLQQRRRLHNRSPFIFPGRYGGARKSESTGAIRRAIDRAGCNTPDMIEAYGKADARTFRDTFASHLVIHGVSLYKVQKLLGHASPQMTQKYAHLVPDQAAQEAADVLDQLTAS